jgi:hypothetical protein
MICDPCTIHVVCCTLKAILYTMTYQAYNKHSRIRLDTCNRKHTASNFEKMLFSLSCFVSLRYRVTRVDLRIKVCASVFTYTSICSLIYTTEKCSPLEIRPIFGVIYTVHLKAGPLPLRHFAESRDITQQLSPNTERVFHNSVFVTQFHKATRHDATLLSIMSVVIVRIRLFVGTVQ